MLDLAFVEGELAVQSLKKQIVSQDEVLLIVSPTHPWTRRINLLTKELLTENYIARELTSSTRHIVESNLKEKHKGHKLIPI